MSAGARALAEQIARGGIGVDRIQAIVQGLLRPPHWDSDPATEDLRMRLALVRELRLVREVRDLRQTVVGPELGVTGGAISAFERAPRPRPAVAYAQRYARAVGCRLRFVAHGLPVLPADGERDTYARLGDGHVPEVADEYHRLWLHAVLVASRRATMQRPAFARHIGLTLGAVKGFEAELRDGVLLETFQRYFRAVGGRLDYELHPIGEES